MSCPQWKNVQDLQDNLKDTQSSLLSVTKLFMRLNITKKTIFSTLGKCGEQGLFWTLKAKPKINQALILVSGLGLVLLFVTSFLKDPQSPNMEFPDRMKL